MKTSLKFQMNCSCVQFIVRAPTHFENYWENVAFLYVYKRAISMKMMVIFLSSVLFFLCFSFVETNSICTVRFTSNPISSVTLVLFQSIIVERAIGRTRQNSWIIFICLMDISKLNMCTECMCLWGKEQTYPWHK